MNKICNVKYYLNRKLIQEHCILSDTNFYKEHIKLISYIKDFNLYNKLCKYKGSNFFDLIPFKVFDENKLNYFFSNNIEKEIVINFDDEIMYIDFRPINFETILEYPDC
jgi:hypothetical protein